MYLLIYTYIVWGNLEPIPGGRGPKAERALAGVPLKGTHTDVSVGITKVQVATSSHTFSSGGLNPMLTVCVRESESACSLCAAKI